MTRPSNNPPSQSASGPNAAQRQILTELLVLRAKEGSGDAFGKLVELWQEPLYRHALRLTGREDAAWDVLQESWMAVAKGLGRLKVAGTFKRWTYTIVTRAAVTRLRRLPAEESHGPLVMEQHIEDTGERDDREQALHQLRAALHQLKREDRVLVSLRYLENFEYWELAKIMGTPEGTLKSRLHRIRRQLKDNIERMSNE